MTPDDVSSSRFKAGRVGSTAATIFAEMSALAIATESVNLGQGFPDYRRPGLHAGRRPSGHRRRASTSTRRAAASAPLRQAIAATVRATTAWSTTPTPRCSSPPAPPRRWPPRSWPSSIPATRSSPSSPSTTPTPPRSPWPVAGSGRRRAVRPGLPPRPGRAAGGVHPAHEAAARSTPRTTRPARSSARAELAAIAELASRHDVLVVCDEVYEHLVFDDAEHLPLADFPGHAGAHHPDLLGGQDVLRHRLEDRLGAGPGAADHRADRGQAVPDLRLRGAVPARGGPGARRG